MNFAFQYLHKTSFINQAGEIINPAYLSKTVGGFLQSIANHVHKVEKEFLGRGGKQPLQPFYHLPIHLQKLPGGRFVVEPASCC